MARAESWATGADAFEHVQNLLTAKNELRFETVEEHYDTPSP